MNRLGNIAFTITSGGSVVGTYNIYGQALATTPVPPLPSGASVDKSLYGSLYSVEVFKLIELLEFWGSSPAKPHKIKFTRPKNVSGPTGYNIRPKLRCE